MEISLIRQIISMAIMVACGYIVVKSGKCKAEDSEVLSKLTLTVIFPCTIINSYQIEVTQAVRQGFWASIAAGVLLHLILLAISAAGGKLMKLKPIEQASIVYTNCGNMIVPLVSAVLGPKMLLYTSAFIAVHTILVWTHGQMLISGGQKGRAADLLKNPNLISVAFGLVMFFTGFRLPSLVMAPISAIAVLIGPIAMFSIGMVLTKVDWGSLFREKRVYLVMILRLVISPLAGLVLLKIMTSFLQIDGIDQVLLVSFLAMIAPSAATVMMMASVYKNDAAYAGAINAMTTVVSAFTMPLMVALYLRVI